MLNRVSVSVTYIIAAFCVWHVVFSLRYAFLHTLHCHKNIFYHCVLQVDPEDQTSSDLAMVLFETATLRSGYQLADTKDYADRIERMLRLSMDIPVDEQASPPALVYVFVVKAINDT